MSSPQKCFIETYGCQMNKADSERMLGLLADANYTPTENQKEADLMILNTCTVREGAAERAFSNLGRWNTYKKTNPNLLIAVGGCMAQEKGKEIQRRLPFIDIVFGTHNLHKLPDLIHKAKTSEERQCELFETLPDEIPETPIIRQTSVTAWVNIILGCNFNCTYCIVPQVRGREKSRSPEFIKSEIEQLASEGFKEITLLGQNVTAYGNDFNDERNLAWLLRFIHDIPGIERIRFLTGHPYHVNEELIQTVAGLSKVCECFHIPMQSGDKEMLRKMARVYTPEYYLEMTEMIRKYMPDSHITSDFIVGFPGETQEQFMNTVKIVEKIKFASCMTAMYSPRRNTPGAKWEEDDNLRVSEQEKHERIRLLNAVVTDSAEYVSKKSYTNTVQEILIEEEADRTPNQWVGRTRHGKLCYFDKSGNEKPGDLVNVKIETVTAWSLTGKIH